jgi:hypothetical protein
VKETFDHSAALQFRKLLWAVPNFDTGTNWSKQEKSVNEIFQTLGGRQPSERAPLKLHTKKMASISPDSELSRRQQID